MHFYVHVHTQEDLPEKSSWSVGPPSAAACSIPAATDMDRAAWADADGIEPPLATCSPAPPLARSSSGLVGMRPVRRAPIEHSDERLRRVPTLSDS